MRDWVKKKLVISWAQVHVVTEQQITLLIRFRPKPGSSICVFHSKVDWKIRLPFCFSDIHLCILCFSVRTYILHMSVCVHMALYLYMCRYLQYVCVCVSVYVCSCVCELNKGQVWVEEKDWLSWRDSAAGTENTRQTDKRMERSGGINQRPEKKKKVAGCVEDEE